VDFVKDSLEIESSLQNAPDKKGNFFKVPPIIEVEE
jgi:Asp-tRNA(Asn)/Glu-tRNA(Gln) amidotransferase C subunit